MALPNPEPGLVIAYRYLWRHEYEKEETAGRKDRPCVVVLAVEDSEGRKTIFVVPITHSKPSEESGAIEIPQPVKKHLGLDSEQSWIIVRELNQFVWPGFDLAQIPGQPGRYAYGYLPPVFFERIKTAIQGEISKKQISVADRNK